MVLKHNYFFYANVCHVCKKYGDGISLKRCSNCTMISYCSKEHQKAHWPQHKNLCNAIRNVLKDSKVSSFFDNKQNVNMENWARMKMNFMLLIAIKVGRKLEHYEEEMFKFLRSCIVCHDLNTNALEDCPDCPNTSFCKKHKNDPMHAKFCNLIRSSFNLDLISMMHKRNIPKIKTTYRTNHYVNLPQSIKDFIDYCIEPQKNPQISVEEETMINTEYLTRPLTFLYAVQKLRYLLKDDSIIVHIIAANIMDIDGIELWEILLHWMPSITMLKLCLIGPELSSSSMSINLCKNCQYSNKQILIQMYGMLYETYANIDSYEKPNFIIGYNAGIHECEDFKSEHDTWRQSLYIIAKQDCPVILTSYVLAEAEKEEIRVNEILNKHARCTYFGQNPYSSLRPYRDFETEGIYYQNQYIIIYKHLRPLY